MNKWSQLGIKTYKEDPSDAEIPSHKLLIRAGMIKKTGSGIYIYGPFFLKALRKFENIIRKELEAVGSAELLMPMVQPKKLWEESGRWGYPDMQTFKNKGNNEFCLGPTHEEVITDYVRNDITSYKELPVSFYQIQNKYRDEIRPRFGLMRGREFLMKDAYSFDASQEEAHKSYYKMRAAYVKIFESLDLEYRVVRADAGAIGGSLTEEFQILADVGEDELLVSDASEYAANVEICSRLIIEAPSEVTEPSQLKKIKTMGVKTIDELSEYLNVKKDLLVKTMFFKGTSNKKSFNFGVLLRGSDEVNLLKIKNNLKLSEDPELLSDAEVLSLTGASPGSCGPQGLSVSIYMDHQLVGYKSMTVGANEDGFHVVGVQPERDFSVEGIFDLTVAKAGDVSPDKKGVLSSIRGIEVGHIFYLGKKYSESMKAKFLDAQGKAQFFEMGCYGIGVSRTLQAAVEQSHDADGIVWPRALAPFDVHVCLLDKTEGILSYVEELVLALKKINLEVFIDDRKERPGVKFKDADLLGLPLRITLGKRGFNSGVVELYKRKEKEKLELEIENSVDKIVEFLK